MLSPPSQQDRRQNSLSYPWDAAAQADPFLTRTLLEQAPFCFQGPSQCQPRRGESFIEGLKGPHMESPIFEQQCKLVSSFRGYQGLVL